MFIWKTSKLNPLPVAIADTKLVARLLFKPSQPLIEALYSQVVIREESKM